MPANSTIRLASAEACPADTFSASGTNAAANCLSQYASVDLPSSSTIGLANPKAYWLVSASGTLPTSVANTAASPINWMGSVDLPANLTSRVASAEACPADSFPGISENTAASALSCSGAMMDLPASSTNRLASAEACRLASASGSFPARATNTAARAMSCLTSVDLPANSMSRLASATASAAGSLAACSANVGDIKSRKESVRPRGDRHTAVREPAEVDGPSPPAAP